VERKGKRLWPKNADAHHREFPSVTADFVCSTLSRGLLNAGSLSFMIGGAVWILVPLSPIVSVTTAHWLRLEGRIEHKRGNFLYDLGNSFDLVQDDRGAAVRRYLKALIVISHIRDSS
jgi:hypothetical protein